jgi:hypothetical protein
LFPLFTTGVIDKGGKFTADVADTDGNLTQVSLTPAANLPRVSLTMLANLPLLSTTTNSTGGKIYRRCRLYRWCTLTCEYFHKFLLLSREQSGYLIPLLSPCTLTCEYFHKFLKKFQNDPTVFSGAWGKMIHEKNLKQKSL